MQTVLSSILLLFLSILPVILLMVFIYFKDKYQKEPVKSLLKAFFGGMLAVVFTLITVGIISLFFYYIPFIPQTVFYDSFITASIPEELCKFLIFMMFIWRDKNFDEYFDGIVYATFISLGFACIENIMYVFGASVESFSGGLHTSIVRALLSVPGHFLFGVILGYFLSLAKFRPEKRGRYIILGLLFAMLAHGLFDWLLMFSDRMDDILSGLIYSLFIAGDVWLWILGMKLIRKQQQNSLLQAQQNAVPEDNGFVSNNTDNY